MNNDRAVPTKGGDTVVTTTIKIEGEAIPKTIEVMEIRVSREINRINQARVSILDGNPAQEDFPASNMELFVPGKRIEIFAGHQSDEQLIFKGIILQHDISIRQSGSSVLKLDCRDMAIKLTSGRKSRYFTDTTDSDAIEDILSEAGLASDLDDTEVIHPQLVQYFATDWDFILTRAEKNGMYCVVDDGKVFMKRPRFEEEPKLALAYGATIKQLDASLSARYQYAGIRALSWDPSGQELLESEAVEPSLVEQGNLPASALSEVIGSGGIQLQHSGYYALDALQSWADASLLRSRMAKARGVVKSDGFAGVQPGDLIQLNGVGDRFNGKVFVSGVLHAISNGKWNTSFQFGYTPRWFTEEKMVHAPLSSGLSPAINGLHIGVVTQLQGDPDGNFRIQVKIPVIGNAEGGIWARMASPDAGQDRGFVFRPEIGDEVVVGFINDDPAHPVVLGGLHSSAKAAPVGASDDNHEKGYVSRSQMRIHFDDDKKVLQLDTPAGNKLALSEKDGGITLEDQNGNKIVLSGSGITIESASALTLKAATDLKVEGMNVSQKAQAQFKAQGSAGMELTSNAMTTLKGGQVHIN